MKEREKQDIESKRNFGIAESQTTKLNKYIQQRSRHSILEILSKEGWLFDHLPTFTYLPQV